MILVLTPNPALDLTYEVSELRLGEVHTVDRMHERAGGKGVNTSGVLTALGVECTALCPVGERDEAAFAADLRERRVPHALVPVPGRVRRTVAAVEPTGRATVMNEPGTPWSADDLLSRFDALTTDSEVVAICGSVPPDTADAVLECMARVVSRGARLVLDVRGPVLSDALALNPDLVKPNRIEAAATLGLDPSSPPPPLDLAGKLVSAGARAAAVSDGSEGVSLVTATGQRLHARLPEPLQGNATGAGDALTAALATHLTRPSPDWTQALTDGVAWSAAAVLQPMAGHVDAGDVARLRPRVLVRTDAS